jgi:hypothetical protein
LGGAFFQVSVGTVAGWRNGDSGLVVDGHFTDGRRDVDSFVALVHDWVMGICFDIHVGSP